MFSVFSQIIKLLQVDLKTSVKPCMVSLSIFPSLFNKSVTIFVLLLPVETCPYAFKCKNGFCIQLTLKCDGVNHCLDKSDEMECEKNNSMYILLAMHHCKLKVYLDQIYLKKYFP